ncbi:MAG: FprA family A-type flavoprotein [Candidatus Hydrothermarchaeales archaeon]
MVKVVLKEGVYWVGAVDWNIRDFHGYALPNGTTYNAYLIVDDKIALVDTVKNNFYGEMLGRIKEIVDPNEIDYVISNHVEMDHSGSLPMIMKDAPNAKIFATQKGREGLCDYYECDWPFTVVKTGDELSLGAKTLSFLEAPMLHWPDSMFTYIKEDRILLPNDAFGQHIASIQRFDDELDGAVELAAEYFANILMPFAPLVLKQLKKVQELGIEIDIIGPSHGIIWRDHPERIIEAYTKWGQGLTKEKALIIYDSMWGSTEMMAKAILEGVVSEGVEAGIYHLRKTEWSEIIEEVLDAKALIIGSPTLNRGMFPTVAGFLTYLKGLRPRNKMAAAFESYGWGGGASKDVNEMLHQMRLEVIEPALRVKFRPKEGAIEQCKDFGRDIAKRLKEGKV